MDYLEHLKSNNEIFFNFMNENFTIFKNSNLFLRDIQYAIMSYFDLKKSAVNYAEAEKIAIQYIDYLVNNGELTQIDHKSWRINFDFGLKKKIEVAEGVENG